jgi:methylated-DNA-[protein]-cysteine S-methyltransferase
MNYRFVDSPFGRVLVAGDGDSLQWLSFTRGRQKAESFSQWTENRRDAVLREAERQLDAYFKGKREQFDLPLDPRGTPFQKKVWKKLVSIPYGKTVTYSELARRVGRPEAFRAVGAANGQNPISVIIPCHRVLGKNGDLTGYGGGLHTKQRLLDLERCTKEKRSAR